MLERSRWYDLARQTNWTPKYVGNDELFPPEMSDPYGVPQELWDSYDEPYKVSYREYVSVQREKDIGAYSVKAALARANFIANVGERWRSVVKFHFGAVALPENISQLGEGRVARFCKGPGARNMATFGLLDEIRHGQVQLSFPHDWVAIDRQFAWAHRAMHTNEWGAIASRHLFDDIFVSRDATTTSIMLTFAFETAFTNMQFLALAADAAKAGDMTFSNMMSSIQTDEARHAQIGLPVLALMVEAGKDREAQRVLDIAFWRAWKIFGLLTGMPMDYYMPLEHREASFKEFLHEWIIGQFERTVLDVGLKKPWYWDQFLEEMDFFHHGMQLGAWTYRKTLWWHPAAGVSREERDWLESKYPGWNDSWGRVWERYTEAILSGREELTQPQTIPVMCSMCQLPIIRPPGTWPFPLEKATYGGENYLFCSEPCRWVFFEEPTRYAGVDSIDKRFARGQVQPATYEGALAYMGLAPEDRGRDATDYAWAETFRETRKSA
jgi:toluene monooxygenase system protein A